MEYWFLLAILALYLTIMGLFITGYRHTTFPHRTVPKLSLSVLWPLLLIVYPRFRRNFQRALKRSRVL